MITRTLFTVALLTATAVACGGSTPSAAPVTKPPPTTAAPTTAATTVPPTTVVATTVAPTTMPSTTIAATTTTPAPTTTVAAFSRESRLAIGRCQGAVDTMGFAQVVDAYPDKLTEAVAFCDEAHSQLDADNPAIGSPGSKMTLQVSLLNLALATANFDVFIDKYDDAGTTTLDDAVVEFDRQVSLLMD